MRPIPIRGEMMASAQPVLDVTDLSIALGQDGTRTPITEDVSFSIGRGEVLALVGESGSGKSVTALALMQLLSRSLVIAKGRILCARAMASRPISPPWARMARRSKPSAARAWA